MDRRRFFYRFVLPGLAITNLALGATLITFLRPGGWLGWIEAATAALCCGVAGWLGGSGWSKAYWSTVINRQVTTWRRMSDTLVEWIEETPIPDDSVDRLRKSIEDSIAS